MKCFLDSFFFLNYIKINKAAMISNNSSHFKKRKLTYLSYLLTVGSPWSTYNTL